MCNWIVEDFWYNKGPLKAIKCIIKTKNMIENNDHWYIIYPNFPHDHYDNSLISIDDSFYIIGLFTFRGIKNIISLVWVSKLIFKFWLV